MEFIDNMTEAAQEVFRLLGSGHSESVYETALEIELMERGYENIRRQVPCPIYYKGHLVGTGLIDILIDNHTILELKATNKLSGKDEAQLRKYLSGMRLDSGLLLNFGPGEEVEVTRLVLSQTPSPSSGDSDWTLLP